MTYCTQKAISRGLIGAVFWSAQFYFMWIDINFELINSVLALGAIYMLLKSNTNDAFFMGGFIGVGLFYWIGFSLYYYDLSYLIPLYMTFAFVVTGTIFCLWAYIKNKHFWAGVFLLIFWFDFFRPFGFNWIMPEVLFAYSYFGVDKYSFVAIVLCTAFFIKGKIWRLISVILFVYALNFSASKNDMSLKIKLVETSVPQSQKWTSEYKIVATNTAIAAIDDAVAHKYDFVVLPETVLPYALNNAQDIEEIFKNKSYDIAILLGALRIDENQNVFNSSYFFKDGNMQIFDKVVAVPFGEKTDFVPIFMRDFINKIFFDGAKDYETAANPSDFNISGTMFRNAICYEATRDELYKDNPKNVIAISNNAWFVPSVEPVYQKALMKYFAKKYSSTIYHSVNKSSCFVVTP